MSKLDFTDPWSLLVRFTPNDTEQVYHVYRPFTLKLKVLDFLVQKNGDNAIIPLPMVNSKVFEQILQLMNEPFCGVIQESTPEEQIELVIGLHKLGIGTDTGFFDLGPIADQICEGYEKTKKIKFKTFQETAERHGLDIYDPVGLVKTLKLMLPMLTEKKE